MNLADALVPKHFDDGEQIIKQGDQADGMYFVEKGIVRITILDDAGHEVEVSLRANKMRNENFQVFTHFG